MKKYFMTTLSLLALSSTINASPAQITVRNSTSAGIPVLVFMGENCDHSKLKNFMEKNRLTPIEKGNPMKNWLSVQWAKLENTFKSEAKDPNKLQSNAQCKYVGQAFLGATSFKTKAAYQKLGYQTESLPSKTNENLLVLKSKTFNLPEKLDSNGELAPVHIVYYQQSSPIKGAPSHGNSEFGNLIHACTVSAGDEVSLDTTAGVLNCKVND